MHLIEEILRFLDTRMVKPEMYGAFHLIFFALSFVAAFVLCLLWKKGIIKNVRRVVLITAIIVAIFELYKQINFSFGYEDGITFEYQWYIFPWQFCSTPLYVGLLAGLSKGKAHDNFCAYLATFALFAGLAVMFYPATVFTEVVGICVQTMICHGSMITIAIFLYYTGHVKTEWKTLWKAVPVFVLALGIAISLNTVMHLPGLLGEDTTFNMFFVCPHCDPELPVYSLVQEALRDYSWGYPVSIVLYIVGFVVCATVMLLLAMGIKKLANYDFDAYYAERDRIKSEEKAKRAEQRRLAEEKMIAEEIAREEAKKAEKAQKKAEKLAKKEEKLTPEERERRQAKREKEAQKKKEKQEARKIALEKKKEEKQKRAEEKKKKKEEKKKWLEENNAPKVDKEYEYFFEVETKEDKKNEISFIDEETTLVGEKISFVDESESTINKQDETQEV